MKNGENSCEHSWVYDDVVLLTNPAMKRRICSKCGKLEVIPLLEVEQCSLTYDELLVKFYRRGTYNGMY